MLVFPVDGLVVVFGVLSLAVNLAEPPGNPVELVPPPAAPVPPPPLPLLAELLAVAGVFGVVELL